MAFDDIGYVALMAPCRLYIVR